MWANCLELTAAGLVEVHIDALQLQVRVAVVGASGVHAMLVTDDLPELGTNLVAALATCRSAETTPSFSHKGSALVLNQAQAACDQSLKQSERVCRCCWAGSVCC